MERFISNLEEEISKREVKEESKMKVRFELVKKIANLEG